MLDKAIVDPKEEHLDHLKPEVIPKKWVKPPGWVLAVGAVGHAVAVHVPRTVDSEKGPVVRVLIR